MTKHVTSLHVQRRYFLLSGDYIYKAEVKSANFMVEHNVPFAVSDHLCPILCDILPDSRAVLKCQEKDNKQFLNLANPLLFQCQAAHYTVEVHLNFIYIVELLVVYPVLVSATV